MIRMHIYEVNQMGQKSSDYDTWLQTVETPQAPDVGELINVLGEPYYVVVREWAYEEDGSKTHCHIRVNK